MYVGGARAVLLGHDSYGEASAIAHQDMRVRTHDTIGIISGVQDLAVGCVGGTNALVMFDHARGVRPGKISITSLARVHPGVGSGGVTLTDRIAVRNEVARPISPVLESGHAG